MMLTRIILAVLSVVLFGTQANAELYMSISGTIKDATTGKGIAGVGVIASDLSTKKNYSAVTDNNGVYYVKLVPEGEYTLYAHPSEKYVFKPYTKTVTVEKGKNVVDANFELPLGGAVSGTIYKSDGVTPLANASLFALTNKGVAISSTGPDGKYLLAGLVPDNGAKIRLITYGYGMIAANNVNIIAGQVTSNVNVTIPPASSGIRGKVYTNDSVSIPITDAFVVLKGDAGFGITTTDSTGNYVINGLSEGMYEATIFKIGFTRKTITNISIAKNQYINQDFYLIEQPLPLLIGLAEKEQINSMVLKYAIDNLEYPEVELRYTGSDGCVCLSVSFTSVIGVGVSVGQSKCICSQTCGTTKCTSVKTVNTICTCFGLSVPGLSGQLQVCDAVNTGYTSFGGVEAAGVSVSAGGGCAGAGTGGLGLYWCSCYATVQ